MSPVPCLHGAFSDARRCVLPFARLPAPQLRLFCFPYAGGDANLFRDWAAAMPADVEVLGVQYPGRGPCETHALIDRCDPMVERLHAELADWMNVDFAFFGHSNGALVSFELARRLDASSRARHRHHFLSARVAAHLPTGRGHISGLPKAEFLAAIGRLGGIPNEVMQDSGLMNLVEPRLRADFALGEHYVYQAGSGLVCDCTTLHGTRDHFVIEEYARRWSELTTGRVRHHVVDGDHFFLNTHRPKVLTIVHAVLEHVINSKKVIL
jgi:medium-chain acyl-[acyl-carrier-protein] hydrolase